MLLIATDEAGYGPKLGPLVVAATTWEFPAACLEVAFGPLTQPFAFEGRPPIAVDDSKRLFRPQARAGLQLLEAIVLGFLQAAEVNPLPATLGACLKALVPAEDLAGLQRRAWYGKGAWQNPLDAGLPDGCWPRGLASHWGQQGLLVRGLAARVLDAARFNRRCQELGNKAQLLSELTVQLVSAQLAARDVQAVQVFSDRHGGRAHYGALLQQAFPDHLMRVLEETRHVSRYCLTHEGQQIEWSFTVKGDSFAPVAAASVIAKYLRERLMEAFNAYWEKQHRGALRPTAGYGADAARFLRDVAPTVARLRVPDAHLVRER